MEQHNKDKNMTHEKLILLFCPHGNFSFFMKKYIMVCLYFPAASGWLLHPVLVGRGGIMTNCPPRPEHINKFIENSARSKNMLQNVQM
jgi:hypothetical protein